MVIFSTCNFVHVGTKSISHQQEAKNIQQNRWRKRKDNKKDTQLQTCITRLLVLCPDVLDIIFCASEIALHLGCNQQTAEQNQQNYCKSETTFGVGSYLKFRRKVYVHFIYLIIKISAQHFINLHPLPISPINLMFLKT